MASSSLYAVEKCLRLKPLTGKWCVFAQAKNKKGLIGIFFEVFGSGSSRKRRRAAAVHASVTDPRH
jgi:hypothetical protein